MLSRADDGGVSRPRRLRDRTTAIAIALGLEALLLLGLLSLGQSVAFVETRGPVLSTFDAASIPEEIPAPEETPEPEPMIEPAPQPREPDRAEPPPEPAPTPPPALVRRPRETVPPVEVAAPARPPAPPAPPAASNQPAYGPPDTRPAGPPDSARVGTAPDGEPLYAAAWYRKPYDDELRGYLSTAAGPGWGLIACRTAPDWRVEDCVALGESPLGSNIARSVLAAAWQFKVRPPRLGGKSMVGAWVRIRIDYDVQRP